MKIRCRLFNKNHFFFYCFDAVKNNALIGYAGWVLQESCSIQESNDNKVNPQRIPPNKMNEKLCDLLLSLEMCFQSHAI